VARGEAEPGSDIDILVSLEDRVDLFAFIGIKRELEELLGTRVDLGTWKSLHLRIRPYVEKDMIHVA
jgi:predicted nucleotidyltransferase